MRGRLVLPRAADRRRWLAARRLGITATDVVKIVGLSRYGSALDVYLDKRVEREEPAGEAAEWGHLLEDPIARRWARQHGVRLRRVGLMSHPAHPHHLASCDRRILGAAENLEVKTRSAWATSEWDDGQTPERVVVQAQWQAHVDGVDRVHIAALIGGQELIERTVERDDTLIGWLRGHADRVWAAVQDGIPPDVPDWQLTVDSLNRLHPDRAGAVVVDQAAAAPLLEAYRAALRAESEAAAAKETAKVGLVRLLGGGDEALVDGVKAWTYRPPAPRQVVTKADVRRLLADHPEVAAAYVTTRTDAPRIHVTKEA